MENIHTELTKPDSVVPTRHIRSPKGRPDLGVFGAIKANCTKQTQKVGHDLGPPTRGLVMALETRSKQMKKH